MSKMIFLVLSLQMALVHNALSTQIDDKIIGKALSEAQGEMELNFLSAKTGFDFNSIPGHARYINSDK